MGRAIGRIEIVVGFDVLLDADRMNRWSATRRARRGLRRSFQSLELFEDISVEDNIRVGADTGRLGSWFTDLVWPGKHALASTAVSAIPITVASGWWPASRSVTGLGLQSL